MIRRLTASSYTVDMLELVKDVPQESKTLVNHACTVERVSPQRNVSMYKILNTFTGIGTIFGG